MKKNKVKGGNKLPPAMSSEEIRKRIGTMRELKEQKRSIERAEAEAEKERLEKEKQPQKEQPVIRPTTRRRFIKG